MSENMLDNCSCIGQFQTDDFSTPETKLEMVLFSVREDVPSKLVLFKNNDSIEQF